MGPTKNNLGSSRIVAGWISLPPDPRIRPAPESGVVGGVPPWCKRLETFPVGINFGVVWTSQAKKNLGNHKYRLLFLCRALSPYVVHPRKPYKQTAVAGMLILLTAKQTAVAAATPPCGKK